jgi:hypothetical protein
MKRQFMRAAIYTLCLSLIISFVAQTASRAAMADDVKAYDAVHDQILKMADSLTMGIVKQFPDKFR